jgi:hypothetical protein
MKNTWLFPVATLVVGAVGGFISGKNTSASAEAASSSDDIRQTRSAMRADATAGTSTAKRTSRRADPEQIRKLPGNSTRIQALMDYYAGLSPDQFEDEACKLENMPMNERIMASILLFGQWAEVDPTSAMAFSNTMGFTGMFVRPTILNSWASVDPANAAKYYTANSREFAMMGMMGGGRGPMGGMGGMGGASIIASEWARQDPAAALTWAGTLTTEKSQAISAVLGEVAKSDPQKATEMLRGINDADLGDAYRSVAASYGSKNFNEAQSWIRTLPADQQAAALAAAIGGLSQNDPAAAAYQLAAMPDGNAKNQAATRVIGDWARVDPVAAANLLKSQTDENAQRDGMRQLMPTWVAKDPDAALQFANSYQAGPVRDSALQSYVWSNQSAPPSQLARVAETISDERDRSRTVGVAAARWMRESPDEAKSFIQQTDSLSDGAKERILEGGPMWGGGRGRGGR